MNKVNSTNKVAIAFLALQLLLPAASFAQVLPPRDTMDNPISADPSPENGGFCTRVDAFRARVTARLAQHKSVLDARRSDQAGRRATVRATQKNRTDEIAGKDDRELSGLMTKLDEVADTTAHKAAIRKFQTAMSNAVTARRAAIKAAQKDFQDSLDDLISSRKAGESAILATYVGSVTTALNKAKADCVGRIREDIVKERLKTSLTAAKERLASDLGGFESQDAVIREYIDTRRMATKRAFDDFKAKAEAARDELKAAFAAEGGVK